MKPTFRTSQPDERGAALVLAIVFMVVIGGIVGATLAMASSGLKNRAQFDAVRDREYAADAAIEYAIAQVRTTSGSGPAQASCTTAYTDYQFPQYQPIRTATIRVSCTNVPTVTFGGLLQRNVVFNACLPVASNACTESNSIIRAQVNFATTGGGSNVITTKTWVQSWSVNK